MNQRMLRAASPILLVAAWAGCGWHTQAALHGSAPTDLAMLQNPLLVPVADREFLWSQIVDTVDDYFKIAREQRVRPVGDVLLEGRIETYPTDGSTLLEPWRKDSTPGFEKLHATLQTIRRYAVVRVVPTDGGYLVEVTVQKELEDLPRPENATAGRAAVRHGSAPIPNQGPASDIPAARSWIPIGRDVSLEQRILHQIQGRVAN